MREKAKKIMVCFNSKKEFQTGRREFSLKSTKLTCRGDVWTKSLLPKKKFLSADYQPEYYEMSVIYFLNFPDFCLYSNT